MRTALALLCLTLSASLPAADNAARNTELLAKYYAYADAGEYGKQADMWAPAGIDLGKPSSPDSIRTSLEDIHRTFPDYASVALETRAVGDTVVQMSRMSGTHRGVARTGIFGGLLQGAAASGRHFEALVTHWWRFDESGKIVWHEVTRDDLGMYRQLGLIADSLPTEKLVKPVKE